MIKKILLFYFTGIINLTVLDFQAKKNLVVNGLDDGFDCTP